MEELGPCSTALDCLVDLLVEKVVFKEGLRQLLNELEAQFGSGSLLEVDFRDNKW